MPFRLTYSGPLRSDGSKEHKHEIRLAIHPQLAKLWDQKRWGYLRKLGYLTGDGGTVGISILHKVGNKDYACLYTERLELNVELDILLLRPEEPGRIVKHSKNGNNIDIDNRLKTLFDALQKPHNEQALPRGDLLNKTPDICHCVLSDDSLISHVSVTADTLLDAKNDDDVLLIITVTAIPIRPTIGNTDYIR